MKIPRDVSGRELCKLLLIFGYSPTRQSGSHIRLTTTMKGEHHITIPDHDSLRIGTLSAILGDVAEHFGISKDELIMKFWG
jgi:predicted RNA binding protein YcfA (HicA-like mRNA interferase family)